MELLCPRGLARGGQAGYDDELCPRPAVVSVGSIAGHIKDRGEKGSVLTGIVSLNEPKLVRRPPWNGRRYVQVKSFAVEILVGPGDSRWRGQSSRTRVPDSRSHRLGTATRYLRLYLGIHCDIVAT